jgi:hypothetical protein
VPLTGSIFQRKAASPVVEVSTEDDLTPIVAAMLTAKLLNADTETTWRRSVTTGAKAVEMERVDFAKMTKEWKKLPVEVQKALAA